MHQAQLVEADPLNVRFRGCKIWLSHFSLCNVPQIYFSFDANLKRCIFKHDKHDQIFRFNSQVTQRPPIQILTTLDRVEPQSPILNCMPSRYIDQINSKRSTSVAFTIHHAFMPRDYAFFPELRQPGRYKEFISMETEITEA